MPNKHKGPDIYPPSIIDPLLPPGMRPSAPDPEGVARDAYLRLLAADAAAGEADSPEPDDVAPGGKLQKGGS